MIDIAVIAPTPHLTELSRRGSIDMALTHLVLANPGYATYFRARAAAGVRVLLDNSACELQHSHGAGLAADAVLQAADRIGATVVVCQDILYDGPGTVAATARFLDRAAGAGYEFMAVPQGSSRAEWLDCHQRLTELGVDVIGLSKLSVPRCFDTPVAEARLACAALLLDAGHTTALHLLGGDRSLPWELAEHRRCGHHPVGSNDSSFAFWYAAGGIPVDPHTGRAHRDAPDLPDLDAFLTADHLAAAHRHIDLLRHAAGLDQPAAPASRIEAGAWA
jgi:hypothetical protein